MRTARHSWLVEKYNSTMGNMPCSTAWPVHPGQVFSKEPNPGGPLGGGLGERILVGDKLLGQKGGGGQKLKNTYNIRKKEIKQGRREARKLDRPKKGK